jgi:hypothetical protein
MIGVTIFGLFLTPVFYVLVQRRNAKRATSSEDEVALSPVTPALENGHG